MKKKRIPRLGVNIDHIATLREARKGFFPHPAQALTTLKKCKVSQVTIHLREDRRHILDSDLAEITRKKILPVNLEMAATPEMVRIALKHKPHTVTLVPEKRQEITTEGGLDLRKKTKVIASLIKKLNKAKIRTSLFIDPNAKQVLLAYKVRARAIEFHTGTYAHAFLKRKWKKKWDDLKQASLLAESLGLEVFAGHGLDTHNLGALTKITQIEEYNIGHSIVGRAVFVGLEKAINEIQKILRKLS
ncbi:pyridoxine 5'-phosphate synthase [bacterium]|nr:pyridoxine 5'-phosphate synthase [bacterium]